MFPRSLYEVSDGVAHREPDVQQQHLHEVEPGQGVQHLLHGARLVLGPGRCLKLFSHLDLLIFSISGN